MDPTLKCVTLWRDADYLERFQGRQVRRLRTHDHDWADELTPMYVCVQDLIDYATAHGIPVGATKEFSYSEDENIMHISYESGELEDPAYPGNQVEYPGSSPPRYLDTCCVAAIILDSALTLLCAVLPGLVMRKKTVDIMDAPDTPANLTIHFDAGVPVRVINAADGVDVTEPLALFSYLNEVSNALCYGWPSL